MGWERRGNRNYYYRSVREGRRVRKQYVGSGQLGEIAANYHAVRRAERDAQRAELESQREVFAVIDDAVDNFHVAVELYFRSVLNDAGFYQHNRGEWRRRQ